MRIRNLFLAGALCAVSAGVVAQSANAMSIGGGVHYLRTLGDIKDEGYKQDSFSILGSLQFPLGPLTMEGTVDYIFDLAGTDEAAIQPQVWALIGGFIYGGAGIGWTHVNDDWLDDPFYALRGGVNLPLSIFTLDLYATWNFQSDEDFENLTGEDLDSLTFAAVARFPLGGGGE